MQVIPVTIQTATKLKLVRCSRAAPKLVDLRSFNVYAAARESTKYTSVAVERLALNVVNAMQEIV